MTRYGLVFCLLFILIWGQLAMMAPSLATDLPGAGEEVSGQVKKDYRIDPLQMVKYGGVVGYIIIILSVVALALVVEYALTIRRSVLMPAKTVGQIKEFIAERRYQEIANHFGGTLIGRVMGAAVAEVDFGYKAMIKAIEETGEEYAAQLERKIEHLNIIGNITPMLGLLGTVIGMLITFNRIFEASQATGIVDPRQLAGGIFKALVTTVMGLIVAIPSLYAYALFRNRIEALLSEVMATAEGLISPFKPATPEEGGHGQAQQV